jgi:hypothetical protein
MTSRYFLSVSLAATLTLAISAPGSTGADGESKTALKENVTGGDGDVFIVAHQRQLYAEARRNGYLITGAPDLTSESAKSDFTRRIEARGQDRKVLAQFCAGAHEPQIAFMLPLADEFLPVVFRDGSSDKPRPDEYAWYGYEHPLVNQLRLLRRMTQGKRLYGWMMASFMPSGDYWGTGAIRETTLEEVEWMICALVGADWDGIVWYDFNLSRPKFAAFAPRVTEICETLRDCADALGAAEPVNWAREAQGRPVSALVSGKQLFVVLLHPDCMPSEAGHPAPLCAPELRRCHGDLQLALPKGLHVKSVTSLLGEAADWATTPDSATLRYSVTGGGEILLVNLEERTES